MSDFCAITNSHRTAAIFSGLLSLQQTFLQIIQNSNFNRHRPPSRKNPPETPRRQLLSAQEQETGPTLQKVATHDETPTSEI